MEMSKLVQSYLAPEGWSRHYAPKQLKMGKGWVRELDRMYRDEHLQYTVLVRKVDTAWGEVQHVCVQNASGTDIPWSEKQRIKNELFGHDSVAIEMFPKDSERLEELDLYHLWVLPEGMELPFGLK